MQLQSFVEDLHSVSDCSKLLPPLTVPTVLTQVHSYVNNIVWYLLQQLLHACRHAPRVGNIMVDGMKFVSVNEAYQKTKKAIQDLPLTKGEWTDAQSSNKQ